MLPSAEVQEVWDLSEVSDHITISQMLRRLTLPRLDVMLAQIFSELEVKEGVVALDAIGFSFIQASVYYTTYRRRKHRDWVKSV